MVTRADVADLMARSMGTEKANAVVAAAADALALPEDMETAAALLVLERIANEPGVVGVAARFAKSRALLRWNNR